MWSTSHPAPAVSRSPAPVVESVAPAPAGEEFIVTLPASCGIYCDPRQSVEEFISPAPGSVSDATASVVEYFTPAPAVSSSPAPVVDDFSRAPAVPTESTVPFVDRGVVYYSGTCEFFDMEGQRWRSQGVGTFQLLRHSEGAKFFLFWQNERLLTDDHICGLVLRLGQSGRT